MNSADPRLPLAYDAPARAGEPRIGVLLSHGYTGSPASIRPWAEYLIERGYSVRVPQLPGHGTRWQDLLGVGFDDWYQTVADSFDELSETCDHVVAGGLSMGGSLALTLAQRRPGELAGLMLVNPAVTSTNKQLLLLPVLKHLVRSFPAIGDDIAKPGATEHGYPRTPLKPLASFVAKWPEIRAGLPAVTLPTVLFRSAQDHVVDPSSGSVIMANIGSTDVTEHVLADSFHVATLDHDAPSIFEKSAEFIERVTRS